MKVFIKQKTSLFSQEKICIIKEHFILLLLLNLLEKKHSKLNNYWIFSLFNGSKQQQLNSIKLKHEFKDLNRNFSSLKKHIKLKLELMEKKF